MMEAQMREVADLLARVVMKGDAPDAVAADVAGLRTEFNTVHYCFTKGAEAHRRWRLA
jgi:glycine hydroxymethyltransferase